MNINHAVNLNLSLDAIPPRLHRAQGDSNSRSIFAALWVGADAFAIPAGATAMVRFGKPDNTGGLYDTTEGGKKVTFSGNTVTAPVAAQMLSVAGLVAAQIEIYGTAGSGTSSERLASFRFFVDVEESAYSDAEIISSDYFNILAGEISAASTAASDAEAWAKGTRNGVAVPSDDPAYHNNAKYWSDNTGGIDLSSDRAMGTLPVAKGGTGAATAEGARTALGLGAMATKENVSLSESDTTGILPVDKGGTGVTTLAALLTAMGIKDYVVEQGTTAKTGITWTWKKWNSGLAEIDGMGRKTFTGKLELTPQEGETLKQLARKGVVADAVISDLKQKLTSARKDARIWKDRYEKLLEQTKDYLTAVKRAPEKVRAFLDRILHTV